MKGLMINDFYIMRKELRTCALMLALYAVLTVIGTFSSIFLIGMTQAFLFSLSIGMFNYDENFG